MEQINSEFRLWHSQSTKTEWHGFPLVSLGSYRSRRLSRWIKALKGGDFRADYHQIALEWIKRRQIAAIEELSTPVFIIPSPSQKGHQADHAFCLAHALSEVTDWQIKNILTFPIVEHKSQKHKKVTERSERQFQLLSGAEIPKGTLIFIDDVVTTGSTADAAWKTLGKPDQFEVWCVAYQPKLAAAPQV